MCCMSYLVFYFLFCLEPFRDLILAWWHGKHSMSMFPIFVWGTSDWSIILPSPGKMQCILQCQNWPIYVLIRYIIRIVIMYCSLLVASVQFCINHTSNQWLRWRFYVCTTFWHNYWFLMPQRTATNVLRF